MRLGGPIFEKAADPKAWSQTVQRKGYRAAVCPIGNTADDATCRAYAKAAKAADILIAEVGAWSNPLSTDDTARRMAIEYSQKQLDLADRIGARCCVNIAGSRGAKWDGPHPDNFSCETFDRIVETTRAIIDAVRPTRAFYALETMPWIYPDSPESYLQLIEAIDRPRLAVHLDPVNMISSPRRFYTNGAFIRDCFAQLGPYIQSCHAKDIALADHLTVHLSEVRPGLGALDYHTFLRELNALHPDTPILLEHLPTAEEYDDAAAYLRSIAEAEGIAL